MQIVQRGERSSRVALTKGHGPMPPVMPRPSGELEKARRKLGGGDDGRPDGLGGVFGLEARLLQFRRQMGIWHEDIDIFAMVRQVMRRVPPWTLEETVRGQGDEASEAALRDLFHLPDGRSPLQCILRVTVGRLKMTGEAHWLLRYPDDEFGGDDQALVKHRERLMAGLLSAGYDHGVAKQAAEDALRSDRPIGFEYLPGAVAWDKTRGAWVQMTAPGKTRVLTKHQERVVTFRTDDPAGGPLSENQWLAMWSDASIATFRLNRDSVRTGGMADLLILLYGVTERDATRIQAEMWDRADPARTEDYYIPIVAQAMAGPGERVGADSVELSKKGRDANWLEFDSELKVRKSGATGVPLSSVGEYRHVNRSIIEWADRALVEHEVLPWCEDLEAAIQEHVVVGAMGITDWRFGFKAVDTRNQELAHSQDQDLLKTGVISPYEYWTKTHGPETAEAMLRDIAAQGLDAEQMKLPWYLSGGKWMPLSQIVAPGSAAASPAASPPAATPPESPEESLADEGGAVLQQGLAAPEAMLQALDAWQQATTEAMRRGGLAVADDEGAAAAQSLPRHMWMEVAKRLYYARSVPEVSETFRDARAVLRKARQRLEKADPPPHVRRALHDAIEEVFIARNRDAARRVAEAAAGEPELPVELDEEEEE